MRVTASSSPAPASRTSWSMPARKAASVLPEPVGAATSVVSPARMRGQPSACASVGRSKRRSNQARTTGWKAASGPAPEGASAGASRSNMRTR